MEFEIVYKCSKCGNEFPTQELCKTCADSHFCVANVQQDKLSAPYAGTVFRKVFMRYDNDEG